MLMNGPQMIAGFIGLGWYVSHNNTQHSAPKAFGGSANERSSAVPSAAEATAAGASSTDIPFHVSPTHTVAKRADEPIPTPPALYPVSPRSGSSHRVHVLQTHRHGRRSSPVNRTSD